jgi:3'-5' exonuclease
MPRGLKGEKRAIGRDPASKHRPTCSQPRQSEMLPHRQRSRYLPRLGYELIASFVDRIAQLTPQIVTFNGNTFDLPVLRYRAMIHAVAAPGLTARPYFNRYTEDALDLCDVLSSFAPHTKASLNELSRIMGLPGKSDSMDGAEVERYFLDGKIKEIADYCESDVVNTYRVWLRYELFRGKLSDVAFQASETDLGEFIRARSNTKQHLTQLT